MNTTQLKRHVEELFTRSRATITKFEGNLDNNPEYAFTWAESAMEAAANLQVAAYITEWYTRAQEMNGDRPLTDWIENVTAGIVQHAAQEVFRMATQTSQSTSVTSNAMERYKMAAWATIASKAFDKARFSGENVTVIFKAVPSATAGKEA